MSRSALVLIAVLLSGAIPASPAAAVDLTGTWTGKTVCKVYVGTSFTAKITDQTVIITQSGTDLNMERTPSGFPYDGKVVNDTKKPTTKGQASFTLCSTTPDNHAINELGRITKIAVKVGAVKATFTAVSFQANITSVETCTWKYKRTDATDPAVPGCPG
jgi:hypothetical protein